MNKEAYLARLAERLKRLPKEDFDRAMEYYQEYFEEAGPENEAQAIEDLGEPEQAAEQILRDLAVQNAEEPEKGVKRKLSAVWIGILAVFAAPVALPVGAALAAVVLAVLVMAAALLIGALLVAVCLVAAAVCGVAGGIGLLFQAPADGVATLGAGLAMGGVGLFAVMGCGKLCKVVLDGIVKLFGKMIKRGKRHEK
ncbi:MAG: DUF1700 domain-containing protein [Eubacteriales bacterium]|nr:DUF1700 domain-containing protein [Eubacteriales bacterium]